MFEGIEGEIALITASAKFDFTIRKTREQDLKIIMGYIEDTQKLVAVLKTRINLLWEATI